MKCHMGTCLQTGHHEFGTRLRLLLPGFPYMGTGGLGGRRSEPTAACLAATPSARMDCRPVQTQYGSWLAPGPGVQWCQHRPSLPLPGRAFQRNPIP